MSPKLKCHQNKNVTKTDMSSKLKYYQNWNVTKTDMSPRQKCHQNWIVTKTEMSAKLKCHQNWNVMKTEMLPKLKCYQNWNVTKHNNVLKIKIKIQEIGTDHLGLVYSLFLYCTKVKGSVMNCTEIQAFVFPPCAAASNPWDCCHKENLFNTFLPLNGHFPGPATLSNQDGNLEAVSKEGSNRWQTVVSPE